MHIETLDSYERECLSDAAHTLLCDFAAGDLERPLHRLEANWEEVFQAVCRNGLLGLTHRYLTNQDGKDYPPPQFRQWVQEAFRFSAIRMALIYRHVGTVLTRLADSGVDYIVTKGPVLAHEVYPHPALRAFNDLDLVVREQDWAVTHHSLVTMGFEPKQDQPQPPPKLIPQVVLYESRYSHTETGLPLEVHYDDLLNAGLISRDVDGFWQRSVKVDIEGVPIRVLSLEDQLIHLCAHVHYHGYTRLNWLSDIAFIVRDHAPEINWERVLDTVQIEEAQVGMYYTLRYLDCLLGVSVPMDVLDALRPDRIRRWWHERYMPESKVLSLQPMWRPDFSFYFRPLLKRLLPDLLVMGRRREKLRYLSRLLLPPRDWMRHHYRLSDSQNLAVHYLLHPLKLAFHYFTEIVAVVL